MRIDPLRRIPSGAPICTSGKRPYKTQRDAEMAISSGKRRRERDPESDRFQGRSSGANSLYRCPTCGWYHLRSKSLHARRAVHVNRKSRRK